MIELSDTQTRVLKLMLDTVGAHYTNDMQGNIDMISMDVQQLLEYTDLVFYVVENTDAEQAVDTKEL